MAPPPEGLPTRAVAVPVQRVDQSDDQASALPEGWLTEPEHLAAAERVDRLAMDYEMVNDLALAGFTGTQFDVFQTELAKYGLAVIAGWIRRGLILARCRERGFGGLPDPPAGAFDDPDTVDQLADETVAVALHHFCTDVLMKHRWDYRRGASLRTYFIGQCLIRFNNIYRAWHRAEATRGYHPTDPQTLAELDGRHVPGVAQLVIDDQEAARALGAVKSQRTLRALALFATGHTQAEIAGLLGVSDKTVERMIANERARQRSPEQIRQQRRRGIA